MSTSSIKNYTHWAIFAFSSLLLCLWVSWQLLAKYDFAYAQLHDVLDITQHTKKYGPKNRNREDFEFTTKAERIRLFAEVNQAIHNDGKGLESISYTIQGQSQPTATLLHKREVVHLKDVARLINIGNIIAAYALGIWLILLLLYKRQSLAQASVKQQLQAILGLSAITTVVVLVLGPKQVFYWLHEVIFPAGNQWHFYYQDSLMTILMKAPYLFGYIAMILGAIALMLFIVITRLTLKQKRGSSV